MDIKKTERKSANIFFKKDESEVSNVQKPEKRSMLAIFVLSVFLVMFIATGSTAYHYYYQYKKTLKNSAVEGKSEAQSLSDTIGKFMELPEGEEPTLATVTDVEKIKDQPFFAKAQNGDKALIYTKNGKAILYRPSTGKIIEVSMISGTEDKITPAPAAELPAQNSEPNPSVGGGPEVSAPGGGN